MDSGCPVIVCSADHRFAAPLAVMLVSLAHHLKRYPVAQVFILDNGIGRLNRWRIRRSVDDQKIQLNWIRIRRRVLRGLPLSGHITLASYARILIPRLLPLSIVKAIYLDSDILVNADIGELWDMPMEGHPLLAVQDGKQLVSDPCGLVLYRELGIPPETKYLNAGVLVMDLDQWRREQLPELIFHYLKKNHKHVIWHDQDGINAILARRWHDLGVLWNYRINCGVPVEKNDEDYMEFLRDAKLMHYTSTVKPWQEGVTHPAAGLFHQYMDRTRFRGYKVKPHKPSQMNKYWLGMIIRKLPGVGRLWAWVRKH